MPTAHILLTYKDKDAAHSRAKVFVEPRINRMFGLSLSLKMPDAAKVAASMQKSGKPAEWVLNVKNNKVIVDLRIGAEVTRLADADIGGISDGNKRAELIQALQDNGVLSATEASAVRKAFPDAERLKKLRLDQAAKKNELDDLVRKAAAAKKEVERLDKEIKDNGG
jgi:hypothetical protein